MTPQEELAALRRMRELEEKASGVPSQPLPGLGHNSTQLSDRELTDLRRAGAGEDGTISLLKGAAQGVGNTVLGLTQLSAHLNPGARVADWLSQAMGKPSPIAQLDQFINDGAERYRGEPGASSSAGKVGEFVGGAASTAPFAALALPAKGAPLLPALLRGGIGGGSMAATQPVYGPNFAAEKATQFRDGAAIGVGFPAVARTAGWLGERTFGPNFLAQIANAGNSRANRTPYAAEGEALADRTRIPFTPGQVSGSKIQTGLENMSRQSLFSADKAFEADKRIADSTVSYVNRMMDRISANPASEAAIGADIQAVTRGAVVKIGEQRDKIAAQQYGAIDAAVGNKPFVQPHAAMRAADEIIAEYQHVTSPEAARIVAQARALKEGLANKQGYTFSEAQKARSYYGKAARGGASVFDDVSHDLNRKLAAKIFGAMSDDIETSATRLETSVGPGIVPEGFFRGQTQQSGGSLAQAVRDANANYRRYSQMIEATKSHPIARLFGDHVNIDDLMVFDKIPPETVVNRLGAMKPTELHMVREFMEQSAPDTWQQYKRLIVEKALDEARTMPATAGAHVVPFNGVHFLNTLGGNKPAKLKQLQAVFSADEMHQIDDAINASRRLSDRFGFNNSGTGPYMEVRGMLDTFKSGALKATATTAGHVLGLRKVANVMFNADGRRALIELSKLPPNSQRAASLVGLLAALSSGQGQLDPNQRHRTREQERQANQARP